MKKLTTILIFLISVAMFSQENITINIAQDARLAIAGDDKGNQAFTPNFTIRSEWQGFSNRSKTGFIFVAPEFEYASLKHSYRRYSINIGATLTVIPRFPLTASIGYGITDHYGAYLNFSSNIQAGYEIGRFTFFADMQITDRKDIIQYNERIRISGFVGIKFNITNN